MVLLGDLLAAARDRAGWFRQWLAAADPHLANRLDSAADREGMSPTAFVRMAVADFSRLASEEDWATLTSSLRDSDDPGTTCLVGMVDWRLTVRGCQAHDLNERGLEPSDERATEGPAH